MESRVFFMGAGASKQDGLPLTSELRHGIAWAIRREPERFENLAAHLKHLYSVDDRTIDESARTWEHLCLCAPSDDSKTDGKIPVSSGLPDVTEWLSTVDWMIREQSSFGPHRDSNGRSALSLLEQLSQVRDLIVQALCVSLGSIEYLVHRPPSSTSTTELFMSVVRPTDVVITTNWDLLLDKARDARFGTHEGDYGAVGSNVVLEHVEPPHAARPRLLKLHGSLSWRYCPRCQRLVIDPKNHVAGDRSRHSQCLCSYSFSELIVTPGFVREYRNVHLLNIWRETLVSLAFAAEWVFVGYSLPADDVGIRALLLRARCIREDLKRDAIDKHPKVTVVSGPDGAAVNARFCGIVTGSQLHPGDFRDYVASQVALNGLSSAHTNAHQV